jgi:hypothetical protein
MIPILGGSFEGTNVRGTVLSGSADWQVTRPDGVLEIEALYTLRADDGTCIAGCNRGIVVPAAAGAGTATHGRPYVRTALDLETASDGAARLAQRLASSID